MKSIEVYSKEIYDNWRIIYDAKLIENDNSYSMDAALQQATIKKKVYDNIFYIISSMTPEAKDDLRRLLKAKDEIYYLPFGISAIRRDRTIDDEIKDLIGGYLEGHHMDAVRDALKEEPG